MASLIGNPQDVLSTPYGYSGQMSPETAIAEQSLNRRRLIANLLTQQGMQQPKGQMVGRFYVAANPLEHVAGLAQMGAGAFLEHDIDKKQKELIGKDQQSVVDAIKAYQDKRNSAQQFQSPQEDTGIPPTPQPPLQAPPQEASPSGPYTGQVGANAVPESMVQTDKPPMVPTPLGANNGDDLRIGDPQKDGVVPGDMSAFAPQAQGAVSGPASPPVRMVEPPAPKRATIDDLAELLTHQHPQVRQYGAMLANQMQKDQERATQVEERGLDREVRREGIVENSRLREAQLQNTMALTQMQIDSRMQQGRDANDLKVALSNQAAELQKMQMQQAADLRKAEIGSRASVAKQHDETLKAIAGMNMEGRKEVAAMKAGNGRALPGSIGQKFIDNSSNLRMAERALDLVSGKTVEGVKGDPNATGMKGYLPDAILQRTDPSGVDTRAAIANLGSMVIHDRSGAAVTASEFPRLRPFIPSANDDPKVAQKKLTQFVNEYRKLNDEMTDFYKESGYSVPDGFHKTPSGDASPASGAVSAAPQAGIVEDGYRFKGGNPADPKSWEKVN